MSTTHDKKATLSNYLWQPAILFIFLFLILNIFHHAAQSNILWAVGAGSLASSACIVLTRPSAITAHPLKLIIAYIVAILCGMLLNLIGKDILYAGHSFIWISFLASVAVIVSIYLMMRLKIEHPPAVGMALVFVIDLKDYRTSILIIAAITILVLIKLILKKQLSDLV